MREWWKDGLFWRVDSFAWEPPLYRFKVNGLGDIGINTCERIMSDDDNSEWAYESLKLIKNLLILRKRWSDRFNNEYIAKNWIVWKWSKLWLQDFDPKNKGRKRWSEFTRHFGYHQETVLYRPQHNVTRDSYTYFYACCVHLDKLDYIKDVTIPFHLYKTTVWVWRRYIITGKGKWLYNLLEKPDYALRLATMRRSIADKLNK